jgi:RHS repeat-associated protein
LNSTSDINLTGCSPYSFGFNGQEKDDEVYGEGNAYDLGERIYDPRVSRFLSIDNLTKDFPWYTPYQYAGNKPISCIDIDGNEELLVVRWYDQSKYVGETYHYIASDQHVYNTGVIYVNASVHSQIDLNTYQVITKRDNSKLAGYELGINGMENHTRITNAAMDMFFTTDNNNQRIIRSGIDYSSSARNANFEGEALEAIKVFVAGKSEGTISKRLPAAFTVYYNYDDANSLQINLTQEVINKYVGFLSKNPDFLLKLEGHTSTEGTDEYNQELGQKRANDVANRMAAGGISPGRLRTTSMGETKPVVSPDDSAEKKAQNRRVLISNEPIR